MSNLCCLGCYGHANNPDGYQKSHCWCWGIGCLVHLTNGIDVETEKVHCCLGPCLLSWGYRKLYSPSFPDRLTSTIQLTTPIGLIGCAKSEKETTFVLAAPCGAITKVTPLESPTGAAKESQTS